jgi:pilus assembly protein FimV
MPQRFHLGCLPLSIAAAFGVSDAMALGFARAQPTVTLGAPLEFSVGLRLDPSEVLLAECVSAEVWIGDAPVPRGSVGASLVTAGGVPTIVVRTLPKIDEPVVTVNVTAGCEAKVSRRFTLFADPPEMSARLPAVVDGEPLAPTPAVVAAVPPPPAQPAPSTRVASARDRGANKRPAAAPRATAARPSRAAAGVPDSTVRPAAAAPALAFDRSGPGARLRLDAPSVTAKADLILAEAAEQRLAALQALRMASDAAQLAASSASTRVSAMEASLETLKRESQANRENMAKLQQRLAEADERGQWTPWLLGAVLAMLGIAGWLYARLKRSEAEKQHAWWSSSQVSAANAAPGSTGVAEPDPAPVAEVPAPAPLPPMPVPAMPAVSSIVVTPPVAAAADRVPATQATQPLPAGLVVPDAVQRDVSIEELLDVEQQAEFFVVLGQDEAAVDLLMGHLRSAGGASPLPYLKLLEIHHRRGDQAAYERMRRRFNDRFNAAAPDWATGLQQGRSLEDYPEVMARIQSRWLRPADAMAELETLLFRTERGQLFDLPAYRDVLFLFTLARDLQEMVQHEGPQVDVLLPMPQSADFEDTGAGAYLGSRSGELEALEFTLQDPTSPAPLSAEASDFDSFKVDPPRQPS